MRPRRKDVVIGLEPPVVPDIVVDGDFEWLRQIVEGLIENALRYATGASRIALHVGRHDDLALLAVRDDGPGWGHLRPTEPARTFRAAQRGRRTGTTRRRRVVAAP